MFEIEKMEQEFNYSLLDSDTATFLRSCEYEINGIAEDARVKFGGVLIKAQEKLSSHHKGMFQKWVLSGGVTLDNAYYYIKLNELSRNLDDSKKENFLNAPKSLQKETMKKNAPEELKERVLSGDITTNKEYKELEKQLKQKNEEIEQLKNRPVETIEKEITIERIPDDYDKIKGGYKALERNKTFYEEQNSDLREEIKQLESILKETPKEDNSHDFLKEEIESLKKERLKLIESTSYLKHVKNLQAKIEELTTEFSPIRYSNDLKVLSENREMLLSFEESLLNAEKWINEIKEELPNKNIIEGDFKNE